MIQLFLLFVLAHFMADFVTQTDYLINRKKDYLKFREKFNISKGMTEHVFHHIIITFVIVWMTNGFDAYLIPIIIIIGFVHYLIDWVKVEHTDGFIQKIKERKNEDKHFFHYLFEKHTFHFILDQVLHLLTIYTVLFLFNKVYSLHYIYHYIGEVIFYHAPISSNSKITLLFILIILLTYGSGYLISSIFKDIKKDDSTPTETAATLEQNNGDLVQIQSNIIKKMEKNLVVEQMWEVNDENSKKNIKIQYQDFNEPDENTSGKYIGYLERLLIGVFVVMDVYQGLVLLGAFKTLTRFKQFESKSFAEYYLIGTLLSMVLGILFGGLVKIVLNN